jgi:hypothetical protein
MYPRVTVSVGGSHSRVNAPPSLTAALAISRRTNTADLTNFEFCTQRDSANHMPRVERQKHREQGHFAVTLIS